MQTMAVTGRLYNLKDQTQNGKERVTFRVGVRKKFVSDKDKADNKTMTFIPMVAYGPTAKFILDYFKDGDGICVGNMEYQTYRTQNAPNEFDDAHIFKADGVGFVPGGGDQGGNGGGSNGANRGGGAQRPSNNDNQGGGRATQRPAASNNAPRQDYVPQDDLPF